MVEKNLTGLEEFKQWVAEGNLGTVKRRIIEAAEGHAILNDEFSQRMDDINRYQDNKGIGDKGPMLESPSVPDRELWESEEEDVEKGTEAKEVKTGEVDKEKKEPNTQSPAQKTKKKNKKKGKKKQ
ncbi:unnamed protein product [Rhizophagus irregularis]|nr:unnamed protein product [Rhizophagus irregularis]